MSVTGLAFVLAFFGGLLLALFRHPIFGLYTYVAVFYLDPPSRWWGETLPDLRWSLTAAAVTIVATWMSSNGKQRASWFASTPAKVLIFYTLWLWVQNLWALDPEENLTASILFTKYVVLYYVIYRIIDSEQKVTNFLLAHVIGCMYLGWLAYQLPQSGRLEGVGGPGISEANALAMQMGTAIAAGAMLMLGEKGWRFWLCALAMPLVLNTIVLSGSRGAFLSLIAAGATMWYLKPAEHNKRFYAFAALGLVAFVLLASQFFWERMGTIKAAAEDTQEIDLSAETRLELVKAQFEMAQAYPMGTGHRGTVVLSRKYLGERYLSASRDPGERRGRASHNTFMTSLVEQGLPGAVLYLILWISCAREVLRLRRLERQIGSSTQARQLAAVGGGLVMVFVAGIFVDYLKVEVQIWLFALLAVLATLAAASTSTAASPDRAGGASSSKKPAAERKGLGRRGPGDLIVRGRGVRG